MYGVAIDYMFDYEGMARSARSVKYYKRSNMFASTQQGLQGVILDY
jgi:hypothetical protein